MKRARRATQHSPTRDVVAPGTGLAGRVFGSVRVLRCLRQGDLLEDHLAEIRHGTRQRLIWLRLPTRAGLKLPNVRDQLEREAELNQRLNHPAVLRGLARPMIDGRRALALEYHDGRTLHRVLAMSRGAGKRLPPSVGLTIALRTLEALAHAHGKGLVHGALVPRTIVVGWDGEVKVSHWGSGACQLQDDLAAQLAYLAPELARGEEPTPRADIFAAGAIVYELFTGRSFFRREGPRKTLRALTEADRSGVDAALGRVPKVAHVVRTSLAVDPAGRKIGADEMGRVLLEALGQVGVRPAQSHVKSAMCAMFPNAVPVVGGHNPVRRRMEGDRGEPMPVLDEAAMQDFVADVVTASVPSAFSTTTPDTIRSVTGDAPFLESPRRGWRKIFSRT